MSQDDPQHVLTIDPAADPVVEEYEVGIWDVVFGDLVLRLHVATINEIVRRVFQDDPLIIRVEGGIAEVDSGLGNVPVRIRDYDTEGLPDSDILVDMEGRRYTERVYD